MASSQQELLPPPEDIDDTHKVYSIAVCCIVLGIVTSLFVLARVGLRFHARAFGADDYAIIPALVSHPRLDCRIPVVDHRFSYCMFAGPSWLRT